MNRDISRLLQPKTVCVIGGGAWCTAVTEQLQKAGFRGAIWPVHPCADDICGLPAFKTVLDLPEAPDATFVGINRDATIGAVERLSRIGAGGAVCFASGFRETADGEVANDRLLTAAGKMPILGPNCYGLINALDGAMLWPDQHGCQPVENGVAILTQSSNIAINLTMQRRGLPIAYVVTCGNQAQLSEADIASALLDDPRVTAIGLHIEGFGDLAAWQALAVKAAQKGVPLVALKVGRSQAAQSATISHTASLAGGDAGASALLAHLGIARLNDLPSFLETLKLLHVAGPLDSKDIASISCSGGEASLMADLAEFTKLRFPALTDQQRTALSAALGPKVALANPLDYHTYIWRDTAAMTAAFSAMVAPHIALTFLIVDFPRSDRCDPRDWDCVIEAALMTRAKSGGKIAMVSTLPELMPEDVAETLMKGGVVPMNGLAEALSAAQAAQIRSPMGAKVAILPEAKTAPTMSEADAKADLAKHGVLVPRGYVGDLQAVLGYAAKEAGPFVLKMTHVAHKSDIGGVAKDLTSADEICAAATAMTGETFLIEAMVEDAVAEVLVGVIKDPAHGFVITIGWGGILTELMDDTCSFIIPTDGNHLKQALTQLKVGKILNGYRGKPAAQIDKVVDAILSVQAYVLANLDAVEEVEVNPLLVTPNRAVAVDALIRKRHE